MSIEPGLVQLLDQPSVGPWRHQIPGIVYQTSPSSSVHALHAGAIQSFREENPSLAFKLFDDEAMSAYMANRWGSHPIYSVFRGVRFGQMRADIFRYCLVYERGGFYLDINKNVGSCLADAVGESSEGFISFEKNLLLTFPNTVAASRLLRPHNVVLQWCFGFVPHHPILDLTINRIVEIAPFFSGTVFNRALHAVVSFTGPGSFTWAVHKYLEENEGSGLQQLPPDFDGTGSTRLPKSEDAFTGPHYGSLRDTKVFEMGR